MAILCGACEVPTDSVERVCARWKEIFTPIELDAARGRARAVERLAARLAAKRLAIEMIGSVGFDGATCLSVEVRNDPRGKPSLHFPDRNLGRFVRLNLGGIFLTLSHTRTAGYAALHARTST